MGVSGWGRSEAGTLASGQGEIGACSGARVRVRFRGEIFLPLILALALALIQILALLIYLF